MTPNFNQVTPNLNQVTPNLNQVTPNLSQVTPNLNQVTPNLNQVTLRSMRLPSADSLKKLATAGGAVQLRSVALNDPNP